MIGLDLLAASPIDLFLEYGFYRRAVIGALLVASLAALLGVHVVLRGMSLIGDGIGHISLAGVAIGIVAGVWPLGAALIAANLGALGIMWLRTRDVVKGDTAIGILFTAGLALAVLVFSGGSGFGPNAHAFLFGNLLAIDTRDLWIVAGVGGAVLLLVVGLGKELLAVTLSAEDARISGLPVLWVEIAFTIATASAVVVAVRLVGALLVSGLLIVPAAAALQLARSFRAALWGAVGFAVVAVVAGLWWATVAGVAPGAAIALAAVALFVVATLAGRGRLHRGRLNPS